MKNRVMIIDDDAEVLDSLCQLAKSADFVPVAFEGAMEALKQVGAQKPDVILCDVRMPKMDGLTFLREIKHHYQVPVVMMSAHADIPMAVEAVQMGAHSFLEKPFDPRRLLRILDNASRLYRLSEREKNLKNRLIDLSGLDRLLIGETDAIKRLKESIFAACAHNANVMLIGETGTGKELVARAIHDLGQRTGENFVAINCALLPNQQFEESLFGVEGGDEGLLSRANGGTLFFDELGSMPVESQPKFLRVLETGEFYKLGSSQPQHSNFRVISANAMLLDRAVAERTFRQDLLFRLNNFIVELPTLRKRPEDIELLFTHFANHFSSLYEIEAPPIDGAGLGALLAHDWPGNVRELRNVCERYILAAQRGTPKLNEVLLGNDQRQMPPTLREAVAVFEHQLISKALTQHEGRMDEVAAALGISRRTLNEKIVKLGLDKQKVLAKMDLDQT